MKNTAQFLVVFIAAGTFALAVALLLTVMQFLDPIRGPGVVALLTIVFGISIGYLVNQAWGWLSA